MKEQFKFLFEEHCNEQLDSDPLPERALALASELLLLPWVKAFLPYTPNSRRILAKLLEGYILAIKERSGWKLDVDPR